MKIASRSSSLDLPDAEVACARPGQEQYHSPWMLKFFTFMKTSCAIKNAPLAKHIVVSDRIISCPSTTFI
ncbi:hypothetical protein IG631_14277 [Alternaria alternata]|nr:hypothetical protein IG631_14277 [Alternaria alternata]